jgi:hypothetical protein
MNDHFAKEAARLCKDQTLLTAISKAQTEAMLELVTVDAGNTLEILRLQAIVKAFDEVLSVLEAAVLSLAPPEGQPVP